MTAGRGRLTPAQAELLAIVTQRLTMPNPEGEDLPRVRRTYTVNRGPDRPVLVLPRMVSGRKVGRGAWVRGDDYLAPTEGDGGRPPHWSAGIGVVGSSSTLAHLADKGHLVCVAVFTGARGARIAAYRLPDPEESSS